MARLAATTATRSAVADITVSAARSLTSLLLLIMCFENQACGRQLTARGRTLSNPCSLGTYQDNCEIDFNQTL